MRFVWITVLSLVGAIISFVQTKHFDALRSGTAGFTSLCSTGPFDCDAIDSSRYAELFLGIPLSLLAFTAFVLMAVVAWVGRSPFWRREALRALFAMSVLSLCFSLFYLYVQFGILHKACLYCLIVDTCVVGIFLLVLSLKPEKLLPHRPNPAQWKTFFWIGAGSLVFSAMVFAAIHNEKMPTAMRDEMIQAVLRTAPVAIPEIGSPQLPSMSEGSSSAPLTIVAFSDFQCPACKRGAFLLHPLKKRLGDQLRVVYKHFPLDMQCNRLIERPVHQVACMAAKAVECFRKKGQFDLAYHAFYENQENLSDPWIREFAIQHGWDGGSFSACLEDPAILERIKADVEQALLLKVESTPTYFINGRKQLGPMPMDDWALLLQKLQEQP